MEYQNVFLEGIGYLLPEQVVRSAELEQQLGPLYQRLRLPPGRLELMTGIGERRFWPPGRLPSQSSTVSARYAMEVAGVSPGDIGALIHASVCRDHLEPATACAVHHALGLPASCLAYDVSNACLGLLNGALQIANMIELGQIRAGLVVGAESARPLVETTIAHLNTNPGWNRQTIKMAIASLTIGSGSCAWVLTDESLSRGGNRLRWAVARAETQHHQLCQSGHDDAGAGMRPLMDTDSEALMREGVAVGRRTFDDFLRLGRLDRSDIDRTICHQVGAAHRKLLLESLGLPLELDYATLSWLGNTGSVALPLTLAMAAERGAIVAGDTVALLGIGSGINCIMAAVDWRAAAVKGEDLAGVNSSTSA